MKGIVLTTLMLISGFIICSGALAEEPETKPAAPPAAEATKDQAKDNTTETAAPAPLIEEKTIDKVMKMINQAKSSVKRMKDFTSIFYKKEYKDKQLPQEKTLLKFRKNPRSVYMKWIGKANKDREMLWVKNKNDGKIKAHEGGFLKLINVNLDPFGSMAMKDNRHPVTEAGFPHTVMLISKDMSLIQQHPDWGATIKDHGIKTIYGAKSHCFEAKMSKNKHPEFYAYQAYICMDLKLKLPNKVKIWQKEDGKVRLVEDYGYEKTKVNIGLSDKDFNPDNEEYKF